MPISATKKEYWCLFTGDKVALVEDHLQFDKSHKLVDQDNMVVYCAEITDEHPLYKAHDFLPLKKALDMFEPAWYGIAAKAYAILNWDRNHQFCGRCGSTLQDRLNQQHIVFERRCTQCNLFFYPRISPSVIVRIRQDDKILMARSPHFPPGAYGLIAGFVDAGENLEETVHREVREEVGITIKNLQYFSSQAWPFPDSLMVAFTADYDSGELVLDKNEIEHAGWYRYNELPGRPSSRSSIASKLIEDFIHGSL